VEGASVMAVIYRFLPRFLADLSQLLEREKISHTSGLRVICLNSPPTYEERRHDRST